MSDWWIDDSEPCPGPAFELQYTVDDRPYLSGMSTRAVDKSQLVYHELDTWELLKIKGNEPQVGQMYVLDGIPVGIILAVNYYRDPWRMMIEMQSYA